MAKLPPHNQRKLNARLSQLYGDRYSDWYDYAARLQNEGATYLEIANAFAGLGVRISQYAVRNWMLAKRNEMARTEAPA